MIMSIFYLLIFITITLSAMLIFDAIATTAYRLYRKWRYINYIKNR